MNRRELLAGLAGVAGGLILPASVAENAEAGRRWWALGAIPERRVMGLDDVFPDWQEEIAARPLMRDAMTYDAMLRGALSESGMSVEEQMTYWVMGRVLAGGKRELLPIYLDYTRSVAKDV